MMRDLLITKDIFKIQAIILLYKKDQNKLLASKINPEKKFQINICNDNTNKLKINLRTK